MSLARRGWQALAGDNPRLRRLLAGLILGLFATQLAYDLALTLPRGLEPYTRTTCLLLSVGAMLGPTWLRRTWWALLAGLAVLLGAVLLTPLAGWLLNRLTVDDGPRASDVIVVLSGSTRGDMPRVSSTERLLHGLKLLHEGWAPAICFTGDPESDNNQFDRLAVELMAGLGLSTAAVVPYDHRGQSPQNTRLEAECIAALARRQGWRSVLLVTSPAHTRRAKLCFESVGLEVAVVPCPTGQYDLTAARPGPPVPIWRDCWHELQGLALYRLRGHL